MKNSFLVIICLIVIGSLAGSALASYYDPYASTYGYGYSAPSSYPGYGYGGMSGYPGYGSGSIDLNGYTISPGSGYYPSTAPGTGSMIPHYTITYMPGTGVSGSSFSTEWYPGDAIISGQGFSRAGHTQTGWSFYDGGPKAFALGQHVTISGNMLLYPYWEKVSTSLYLTVNYSGYGAVRLSGGNVPSGWTGKLEPGQSFNFVFQPYEGYYVYSIFLAGWYRNVQYGYQFMVTYEMLQGQNQTMTIRFESIYLRPKTGDDSNLVLWVVMALMAAIAAGVTAYRLKKGTGKKVRIGAVRSFFLTNVIILLIFTALMSRGNWPMDETAVYFQKAFPLVVKGDDYLQDMVFVEPQQSDLFEAYGYSASEKLLVTLTKENHVIHYYPDTDAEMFHLLSTTTTSMDDFLLAWANGEWSPYTVTYCD